MQVSLSTRLVRASVMTLLAATLAAPVPAFADDMMPTGEHTEPKGGSVMGDVWIVLASGEEGSIDPNLSQLRGLRHPPLDAYKSMKVLSRNSVPLPLDQPVEVALPKRRTLVLRLVEKLPDGRAKVQLSIHRPNQRDSLPLLQVIASEGEPLFIAGQRFEGGTLVIGIRVIGSKLAPK